MLAYKLRTKGRYHTDAPFRKHSARDSAARRRHVTSQHEPRARVLTCPAAAVRSRTRFRNAAQGACSPSALLRRPPPGSPPPRPRAAAQGAVTTGTNAGTGSSSAAGSEGQHQLSQLAASVTCRCGMQAPLLHHGSNNCRSCERPCSGPDNRASRPCTWHTSPERPASALRDMGATHELEARECNTS
jgi:hypothetical protein